MTQRVRSVIPRHRAYALAVARLACAAMPVVLAGACAGPDPWIRQGAWGQESVREVSIGFVVDGEQLDSVRVWSRVGPCELTVTIPEPHDIRDSTFHIEFTDATGVATPDPYLLRGPGQRVPTAFVTLLVDGKFLSDRIAEGSILLRVTGPCGVDRTIRWRAKQLAWLREENAIIAALRGALQVGDSAEALRLLALAPEVPANRVVYNDSGP